MYKDSKPDSLDVFIVNAIKDLSNDKASLIDILD